MTLTGTRTNILSDKQGGNDICSTPNFHALIAVYPSLNQKSDNQLFSGMLIYFPLSALWLTSFSISVTGGQSSFLNIMYQVIHYAGRFKLSGYLRRDCNPSIANVLYCFNS